MPLPVVQPRPSGDKNQESTGEGLEASCLYNFVSLRGVNHRAKDKILGALFCRRTGVAAADSAAAPSPGHHFARNQVNVEAS